MYKGSTRSSAQSFIYKGSTRSSTQSFMYKGSTRSSAQSSIRSSTRSSTYRGFTRSSTYRGSTRNSTSGPRYIPNTAIFTTSFHQIRCAHLISLQSPPTVHSNCSEQRPRRTTKGVRYNYYVQLVAIKRD